MLEHLKKLLKGAIGKASGPSETVQDDSARLPGEARAESTGIELIESSQQSFQTVAARRAAYAKTMPAHVDFSAHFEKRTIGGAHLIPIPLGQLSLPSGKFVVADPFYFAEKFTGPFKREIAPGDYTVELALVVAGEWGHRIAFARVCFGGSAPSVWELAETTVPGELNVFIGVDTGMVCLADANAATAFADSVRKFYNAHPDGNYYNDILSSDIPADANWGIHRPDPELALDVILISSGLGDGVYTAYWGLGADGVPVELVLDFQLFDERGSIFRKV